MKQFAGYALRWAILSAALIVAILAGPGGSPVQAATTPLPFYARTIARVPLGFPDNVTDIAWLQTSGNWAAYTLDIMACGHCGAHRAGLHLINLLNTRHVDIRTAGWDYPGSSGGGGSPVGMGTVVFQGAYLVWTQPGPTHPPDYKYVAGDYDCTVCYYNVNTGQGGRATALEGLQTLDAQGRSNLELLDANATGLVLAVARGAQDKLWTVNLASGEQKLIAGVAPQPRVTAGALYDNSAAWLAGGNLYAVGPDTPQRLVAGGVIAPQGTEFSLFWRKDSIYMDAQPQPARVGPAGFEFSAVNPSRGFGPLVAWVEGAANDASTLNVAGPNQPPLLHETVPGRLGQVRLAYDHLIYVAEPAPDSSGVVELDIELVWLVAPDPAVAPVWARADAPVAAGSVPRSWLWGPASRYSGLEAYAQSPSGAHQVVYYDKARLEVNNPDANPSDPYYVTSGLLTVEMIGGAFEVGSSASITASVPCTIPVAGDQRAFNPLTPDYATLAGVASLHGDHQAPMRTGQPVDGALDVHGVVSTDKAHAGLARYAAFVPQTGHNIPDVFWTYLQALPATYGFDWTRVLGYPITEGYWTQMRVGGKDYAVLIQAYQRRVLTYVSAFAPPWQIQQGNVGQHYLEWRYSLNR